MVLGQSTRYSVQAEPDLRIISERLTPAEIVKNFADIPLTRFLVGHIPILLKASFEQEGAGQNAPLKHFVAHVHKIELPFVARWFQVHS